MFPPLQKLRKFLEFVRGSVLVGYFFPFDLEMIRKLLKGFCPSIFLPYFVDVLDLYPGEKPSNMESMLSALGIPSSSRHSALEDAYMTALIFLKLIKPHEKKEAESFTLKGIGTCSYTHLDKLKIFALDLMLAYETRCACFW